MQLATVRTEHGTAAVRVDPAAGRATEIGGAEDVGQLLADPTWRDRALGADGPRRPTTELDFDPLVPRPDKIVCVGLNYRRHIEEMGLEVPQYPTLFAKYRSALVGTGDDIVLPTGSACMDWEAELAVVIGSPVRDADQHDARAAIAGYSILNDVTARDFQTRSAQWLQGKTFEHSTPLGPVLVTADEHEGTAGEISCRVNGEVVQQANIADLVFGPVELVVYLSNVFTLLPGDVISTGTPGGVGAGRTPPRWLQDGDVLVTSIEGIGSLHNVCRRM